MRGFHKRGDFFGYVIVSYGGLLLASAARASLRVLLQGSRDLGARFTYARRATLSCATLTFYNSNCALTQVSKAERDGEARLTHSGAFRFNAASAMETTAAAMKAILALACVFLITESYILTTADAGRPLRWVPRAWKWV